MDDGNPGFGPVARYTGVAILLHWLIAALMGLGIVLVWVVNALPDDWVRPAIDTHKSLGIAVLALVLLRLLWRLGHAPPPLPQTFSWFERRAASLGHLALYAVMLALPLSGWLHDSAWKDAPSHPMFLFGLIPWPRIALIATIEPVMKERLHDLFGLFHSWVGYAFYALFVLHVGAALKHQWLDGQPELQRMAPRSAKHGRSSNS